jgi:uncharacterized protein DUF3592
VIDSPTALEYCDEEITAATQEDLARALARQPRGEDWYLALTRANDDCMDATLNDDGTFQVGCEENGKIYESSSVVDEPLLAALLTSFLARDDSWTRLCKWEQPSPVEPSTVTAAMPKAAVAAIGAVTVLCVVLFLLNKPAWILLPVALAIPGFIAYAIVSKLREVRRAATWTKGTARIVRSELVTEERSAEGEVARTLKLPRVEYEFSVGFNKFRGKRVGIGEIMPNTPQVQAALDRYATGASVPVYYDPADPTQSVLERDLPHHFAVVWVFLAVFAVVCVSAALWVIGAFK